MRIRTPKDITECRAYFAVPETPRQRQYEALRAYFAEGKSSADAAKSFGYTTGTFRVMCHEFRRNPAPAFFAEAKRGPKFQPQKSQARVKAVELRKLNHSVYEISELLKAEGMKLSPTAVGELLKAEGFARLPRRLDDERPGRLGPAVQAVADARATTQPDRHQKNPFTQLVRTMTVPQPKMEFGPPILSANGRRDSPQH